VPDFTVRINSTLYYKDMHLLERSLFGDAIFKNRKKKSSKTNSVPTIHTINVIDDVKNTGVTLFVRDDDLYTVGFRGKDKQLGYVFHEYEDLATTSKGKDIHPVSYLKNFKCSYAGGKGLKLFYGDNELKQHTLGDILNAIQKLNRFGGEGFDGIKMDVGILIFVISESLRFVKVRERINQVVSLGVSNPALLNTPTTIQVDEDGKKIIKEDGHPLFGGGGGGSFYFKEFEKEYKDWEDITNSEGEESKWDIHLPHARHNK